MILVFLCVLLSLSGVTAQTYYYNETKTFNENGYSYQCDKPEWGIITLYNKANQYTYAKKKHKDGTAITDRKILDGENIIEKDNWTRQKCFSIVSNAFSADEKTRVKGKKFMVSMTIDTSTGKVIEVDFNFHYSNVFGTIPVSTYRKIELELKDQIWFTLTNAGKSLNFTKIAWRHEVK